MNETQTDKIIIKKLKYLWNNEKNLSIVLVIIAIVFGCYCLSLISQGVIAVVTLIDAQIIAINATKNSKNEINSEARGYLRAAEKITIRHVIPEGIKRGAYQNSSTLITSIRDQLYDKGMSLLSDNDGEKEIWWWKIRYKEFTYAYGKQLPDKYNNKNPEPEPKEKELLFKWHDEILEHIKSFPDAIPKDKQLLENKFAMYILMLEDFTWRSIELTIDFDVSTDNIKKFKRQKNNLELIDNSYNYYKSFINDKEKEGITFLNGKPSLVLREIAFQELLARKLVETYEVLGELGCNNKYFDIYADSVYKKFAYLQKHRTSLHPVEQIYFGVNYNGILGSRNQKTRSQKVKAFTNKCKGSNSFKKYLILMDEIREIHIHEYDKHKINPANKFYQLKKKIN